MKNKLVLELSRKQFVLLLWVVESVLDFLSSLSRSTTIDSKELKDFYDYLLLFDKR